MSPLWYTTVASTFKCYGDRGHGRPQSWASLHRRDLSRVTAAKRNKRAKEFFDSVRFAGLSELSGIVMSKISAHHKNARISRDERFVLSRDDDSGHVPPTRRLEILLKYQPQRGARRCWRKVIKSAVGNAQDPEIKTKVARSSNRRTGCDRSDALTWRTDV